MTYIRAKTRGGQKELSEISGKRLEDIRKAKRERKLQKLRTRFGRCKNPVMTKPITDLHNCFAQQDVYVVCAAPSLDYIAPSFFEQKNVIALNFTYTRVPYSFVVCKLPNETLYKDVGDKLITSRNLFGNHGAEWNTFEDGPSYYMFDHENNRGIIDYSVLGTDKIIVGKSTTVSAIHLAAYMGAKNIILCGVDGGTLDGEIVCKGYDIDSKPHAWESYRHFVREAAEQSREVCNKLKEFYKCNIYSLNPFLDFTFDGHIFEPA